MSFKCPHSNHHHQQQTTGFGRFIIFFIAKIVSFELNLFLTPGTPSTCSPRPWCPTAPPQGAGPPGCLLYRLVCLCLYFTPFSLGPSCRHPTKSDEFSERFQTAVDIHPTSQNGPYLWKSCACISYYLAIILPCNHVYHKKIAT